MSEDKANEYFSDGISEELLNLLSKIPQLKVAARTSSFSFKGKQSRSRKSRGSCTWPTCWRVRCARAATKCGSPPSSSGRAEGYHLWSETYDRKVDDIFKIQDEIAGEVVKQLKVTLLGAAPTVRQTDPKAYTLYLQAVHLGRQKTPEAFTQSDALYRQVLEIDPRYAPAWPGWRGISITRQTPGCYLAAKATPVRARRTRKRWRSIQTTRRRTPASVGSRP